MNVTVEFLPPLNGVAGTSRASASLPEGGTVSHLIAALREQFPRLSPVIGNAMFMVEGSLARPETRLRDGERVLILKILGGG